LPELKEPYTFSSRLICRASLFFPSFFGDDGYNSMSSAEVNTATSFL
jgi:hypothetical protein